MTADELRAAYPGAADAVVLHELHESSVLLELAFMAGRASNKTPERMAQVLKDSADAAIAEYPGQFMGTIRPQMDHPDFLRYVAAKLGAM